MPRGPDQRALLKADIARLQQEKVAALHGLQVALHEEIRALEAVHAARAAQQQAKDTAASLDVAIDCQLEALNTIPGQREP
jgi:hypothetical protein